MSDTVHGQGAKWCGGWSWSPPMHGEHFRRCSFCGSVAPGDLTAEPAWSAEWAYRKYGWPHKFYVSIPNRDPSAIFCVGSQNFQPERPGPVAWADLTDDQLAVVERDGMGVRVNTWYSFGTRPSHYGKFYTVHLADPAIPNETKETIQRVSGLRFTFEGGEIRWLPYEVDAERRKT